MKAFRNSKSNHLLLLIAFLLLFISLPASLLAITVEITATVPGCGDGDIGIGEQCEGSNLGGSSCSSLGFTGGSLSCTSACTFNTSLCTTGSPGGSGGGGGGSGPSIPATNIVFTGRAYPLSRVSILKDGQLVVTTIAGPDSNFTATISSLSAGNYNFAVYGEDKNNIRSSLFTFPIFITSDVTTKISGIFIAPTIATDKSEVRRGDSIVIFGQSVPLAEITVSVNSEEEVFVKKMSDANGAYLVNFDTSFLEVGQHQAKSKSTFGGEITPFGKVVAFLVGAKNVNAIAVALKGKGDLNSDNRINLVDFSIAAYWYGKPTPPKNVDFNEDGKVNLIDFSIMAFYWTG